MSDFYDEAARQRYAVLEAAKARVVANLEEYRVNGDESSAAEELQNLATLNDQQQSLQRLHRDYHQQRNPPQQERESIFASHRAPKDGNDVLEIMNAGKNPGDKTYVTADDYNRGLAELYRRKSLGDYHGKP
jgi:hypothetical protein